MNNSEYQKLLLKMHEQEIDVYLNGDVHLCFDREEDKLIEDIAEACRDFEPLVELNSDQVKRHEKIMAVLRPVMNDPALGAHLEDLIPFEDWLLTLSHAPLVGERTNVEYTRMN